MTGPSLDATQLDRYSRHVIMDEIGPQGQAALLDASVLVVGAGGLGSPVIQYLAAAGVGTLGVVDDDVVERSNLQRQIVHRDEDVGRPKVESAAEYVRALNPDVTVNPIRERLGPENARGLIADYDLVVDASDNFRTRYVVNDACVLEGVPLAHGAIYKFEGQIATFEGGQPCYRCLFPEAPPEDEVPDCATTGVLGVLPGTVGTIQATEALKLLIDFGDPLVGRMVFYDASDMTFEELSFQSNPSCPVCGDDPIESLASVDYASEGCQVEAD